MNPSSLGSLFGPSWIQRAKQSQQARAQQQMLALALTRPPSVPLPLHTPGVPNPAPTPRMASTTTSPYYYVTAGTAGTTTIATATAITSGTNTWGLTGDDDFQWGGRVDPYKITVRDGDQRSIHLPDGTIIEVAKDGSFKINDADAKVIYRANRVRDFNAFLNASDKLEEFIRFCGEQGARKGEALDIPIKLFIGWLILEAAQADGEPEPEDVKLLPDLRRQVLQPRCVSCGRFIRRIDKQRKIEFCGTRCFERRLAA